MTCKHIDIVAVAALLLSMALFSSVRRRSSSLVMAHKRVVVLKTFYRPLMKTPHAPVSHFLVFD